MTNPVLRTMKEETDWGKRRRLPQPLGSYTLKLKSELQGFGKRWYPIVEGITLLEGPLGVD